MGPAARERTGQKGEGHEDAHSVPDWNSEANLAHFERRIKDFDANRFSSNELKVPSHTHFKIFISYSTSGAASLD